ncbi:hypothetical protein H5T88_01170 [bacterium]|nr:hypothetical protein [bacterium]
MRTVLVEPILVFWFISLSDCHASLVGAIATREEEIATPAFGGLANDTNRNF